MKKEFEEFMTTKTEGRMLEQLTVSDMHNTYPYLTTVIHVNVRGSPLMHMYASHTCAYFTICACVYMSCVFAFLFPTVCTVYFVSPFAQVREYSLGTSLPLIKSATVNTGQSSEVLVQNTMLYSHTQQPLLLYEHLLNHANTMLGHNG